METHADNTEDAKFEEAENDRTQKDPISEPLCSTGDPADHGQPEETTFRSTVDSVNQAVHDNTDSCPVVWTLLNPSY